MAELTRTDIRRLNEGLLSDLSSALSSGYGWQKLYDALSDTLVNHKPLVTSSVCDCRDGIAGVGHEDNCALVAGQTLRATVYGRKKEVTKWTR